MGLENFGVNAEELKTPTKKRVFNAWIETWEETLLHKNDVVAEIRLLEKYKNMVFYDPDNKCMYTVHPENLDWQHGRGRGWHLIAVPSNKAFDDEPFQIGQMVIDLIAETDQNDNVKIVQNSKTTTLEDSSSDSDSE